MELKKIGNYLYEPNYIGKGTFSKVYKGYHIDNKDNIIAIKKIHISNKKINEYIEHEVNIMKNIKHDNILELYDIIYTTDFIYLILEYCDIDLYKYIEIYNISNDTIEQFIKQLVNGLEYMVNKKILHRDLKPHNILINKNNILKIADFGFAREFDDNYMNSTFVGSPLYMSPEIILNNNYNLKSDLWSLGIILYQLYMKKHPFHSTNIKDLIDKMKDETNYKSKILFNDSVPNNVQILINRLLEIDIENRITWDELFNDSWIKNIKINKIDDIIIEQNENKIENDDYEFIFDLELSDDFINNKKKPLDKSNYIIINYDEVEENNNIKNAMSNSINILKKWLDL